MLDEHPLAPVATARMLAVEFAHFYSLELSARAKATDIVKAVCATPPNAAVELVLVDDEIHNLNLAAWAGAEVSDQLKWVTRAGNRKVGPDDRTRRRPDLPCEPLVSVLIIRNQEPDTTGPPRVLYAPTLHRPDLGCT